MSKIQNATGRTFENEIMQYFTDKGYWTKKMNGLGGTVFDILVIGKDLTLAIEAKHVAKGDKLNYTRELQKKTDEMNRYNDMTHNLYLVVGFGNETMFAEWGVALHYFNELGYLPKGECIAIARIKHYHSYEE